MHSLEMNDESSNEALARGEYKESPFFQYSLPFILNVWRYNRNEKIRIHSESEKNSLENKNILEYVLEHYMPFAPLWTGIMHVVYSRTSTKWDNSTAFIDLEMSVSLGHILKDELELENIDYLVYVLIPIANKLLFQSFYGTSDEDTTTYAEKYKELHDIDD
ncbi:hypothetical protein JTB14_026780 [Gonioctena quinquepunctata]|nr:hypothetical protein JTB14_026780 [Gonioctena quinquepunctata]